MLGLTELSKLKQIQFSIFSQLKTPTILSKSSRTQAAKRCFHNKVNKPSSCDVNHTGPKLVQIQDLYRIQREHLESYLTIKTRGKERLPVKELFNKDLFPTT